MVEEGAALSAKAGSKLEAVKGSHAGNLAGSSFSLRKIVLCIVLGGPLLVVPVLVLLGDEASSTESAQEWWARRFTNAFSRRASWGPRRAGPSDSDVSNTGPSDSDVSSDWLLNADDSMTGRSNSTVSSKRLSPAREVAGARKHSGGAHVDSSVNLKLTPEQLFHLWTEGYEVEVRSRRRLQLTGPDGTPIDMEAFSEETMLTIGPHYKETDYCPIPAPHLVCCDDVAAARRETDDLNPDGTPPAWTVAQPSSQPGEAAYPRPPWVKGEPKDNLPMTHQVQTDLWLHQHPEHRCPNSSPRFLLTWWDNPDGHGAGWHLHMMSVMLALAIEHNRLLVFLNYTYHRAQHEGCDGVGQYGSYNCYWLPVVSQRCEQAAMDLWKLNNREWRSANFYDDNRIQSTGKDGMLNLIAGGKSYIIVSALLPQLIGDFRPTVPTKWGEPWKDSQVSLTLKANEDVEERLKLNWWRSQSVRYLMRWSSQYTCHLMNFARHQAFGMEVAKAVLEGQQFEQTASPDGGVPPAHQCRCIRNMQDAFRNAELLPFQSVDKAVALAPGPDAKQMVPVPLHPNPYVPRGMVWIQIRKPGEKGLNSFQEYMQIVDELRVREIPQVDKLWLGAEEQEVLDEARTLSNWTTYSLVISWDSLENNNNKQLWSAGRSLEARDYLETNLCHLLMCEETDAALFALQSSWDRLANELRLTGGRMQSPFAVVNDGEW